MSITFSAGIPSLADRSLMEQDCPECGHKSNHLGGMAPVNCDTCMGYGGNPEAEAEYWHQDAVSGDINVCNGTAEVVFGWLGLIGHWSPCGSMNATQALIRLATVFAPFRDALLPSEGHGVRITAEGVSPGCLVISPGISGERMEEVHGSLVSLCERAINLGHELSWS